MEHEKKQDKRLIGHKHTEKTKEKIRQANIGHVVTKETREKLSKWRTGKKFKPHTEETKRKMSISAKKIGYHNSENGIKKVRLAQLKRMKENHPKGMLGKKHDNIAKQKMSEASKERWKNPNSKFNSK
jgi:translation initiation factor 2 gamma subunit (eIF-2gamma)